MPNHYRGVHWSESKEGRAHVISPQAFQNGPPAILEE